ncbi:MAG: 4-hydroxythreonine-4-phosphate dehydrogenase PdxA [Cohaesibacter sp.]|jgi:4-hydroxythreonine-4-phosphate dehydrogenase|nr:4-hydroxythreonine-4-phosphate dehydrogenase PdxA [Cohaesibacter sp.]
MARSPLLALSLGEPAGIGPELALKAWLARKEEKLPAFAVLGCATLLREQAKAMGLPVPIKTSTYEQAASQFETALPVIPLSAPMTNNPGTLEPDNAPAIIEAIEEGTRAVWQGKADALVTCPIQKSNLYAAGFSHPGHTEFLGALAKELHGEAATPVMLLAGPDLRTIPLTVHIPLADVPKALTTERIKEVARIAHKDLKTRFGISSPRIVVAGLNPHAGEAGTMGKEDDAILAPAIAQLQQEGLAIRGPLPADTLFHARARKSYDVVLAAYHDQALIPVKTLAFDETVNVTLGLPFVRTSPDHGTALDIAGKAIANPQSLICAIRLAGQLSS